MLRDHNNDDGNDNANKDSVYNYPTTVIKIRYVYAGDSAAQANKSIWRHVGELNEWT